METAVDLYWIPLGAGERLPVVRVSGRIYEALAARRAHRPPAALFHAALIVRVDDVPWAVEMGPAWKGPHGDRGSVASGPVAVRALSRSRYFRYEVRCWPDGVIPDLRFAVCDPCRVPTDPARARRLLELVHFVPTFTWSRDELRAGDMWNSNSFMSWLLASSGHGVSSIGPPDGGRAPGWWAGLVLAERQAQLSGVSARTC